MKEKRLRITFGERRFEDFLRDFLLSSSLSAEVDKMLSKLELRVLGLGLEVTLGCEEEGLAFF